MVFRNSMHKGVRYAFAPAKIGIFQETAKHLNEKKNKYAIIVFISWLFS